jgi:hypothetical protein
MQQINDDYKVDETVLKFQKENRTHVVNLVLSSTLWPELISRWIYYGCKGNLENIIRVARCFLVQTYQNGKNLPNDHKLYVPNGVKKFLMGITYDNIFHSKALQILPKLGFLVWK